MAKIYLSKTKPIVIWVTWSVWKTSSRMVITKTLELLVKWKKIYTSWKNFNWELWISFSIFEISSYNPWLISLFTKILYILFKTIFTKPSYDIIFLEYWIDHIWEMDFMLSIVKPDFSIITTIDKVHCLHLWNPDITAKEKYKLAYSTKNTVFLNVNDPYSNSIWDLDADLFYYTDSWDLSTDITFSDYFVFKDEWLVSSSFNLSIRDNKIKITTNLLWKENAWYIWVWIIMSDIINHIYWNDLSYEKSLNLNFELQNWRFSFFDWINSNIILDSTYNAAPASMSKVIDNIVNIKKSIFSDYKLVLVLWDMRELWDFAESEHRNIAFKAFNADYVFLLWDNMSKYTKDELLKIWFPKENLFSYLNFNDLWLSLKDFLISSKDKHIIVFKWSQNTIFLEEAIKYVLANEKDFSNLVRQERHWLEIKNSW